MLKPEPAVSIAVMLMDTPVAALVKLQHPPQLGEFHTTSKAPPMKGNDGISLNVANRPARPFAPFEHATLLSEPSLLSYVVSKVTFKVVEGVEGSGVLQLPLGLDGGT